MEFFRYSKEVDAIFGGDMLAEVFGLGILIARCEEDRVMPFEAKEVIEKLREYRTKFRAFLDFMHARVMPEVDSDMIRMTFDGGEEVILAITKEERRLTYKLAN